MMGNRNDFPLKEKYRLWWEYLKRHDELKEIFDWQKKNPERKNPSDFPRKFRTKDGKRNKYLIGLTFGNIFEDDFDFDKWWTKYEEERIKPKAVVDYISSHQFEEDCEEAISELRDNYKNKSFGSERDLLSAFQREFIKCAGKSILSFPVCVYLFMNKTNEELGKEFLEVVESKRKGLRLPKKSHLYKGFGYPMEPFLSEDLKRYLQVYDLRKSGKTYPEIQRIIEKEFGSKSSYYRTLPEDFKIANRIIENAALGLFPKYKRKVNGKEKRSS
jgi:hypothetical protein